jgi:hypothetical protein
VIEELGVVFSFQRMTCFHAIQLKWGMQKRRDQSVTAVPVLVKCPAVAEDCAGLADKSAGLGDWHPVRVFRFRDGVLLPRQREILVAIVEALSKNRLTLGDAYQRLGPRPKGRPATLVTSGREEKRVELELLLKRKKVAPTKDIHTRTLALHLAEALRRTKLVPWWDGKGRERFGLLCDDNTTAAFMAIQFGERLKICKGCDGLFTGMRTDYHSKQCGNRARQRKHRNPPASRRRKASPRR